MPAHRDLSGQSFNGVTVLAVSHKNARSEYFYECHCPCGALFTANGYHVRKGHTKSCGCLPARRKHGLVSTAEYGIWNAMKARCLNPNVAAYADYGGRGISVCERWLEFRNFFADMGERPSPEHSIDRIDNDGDYEPGNVRWATKREQALNRRNRRTPHPCEHCRQPFLKNQKNQRFCSYSCRGAAMRRSKVHPS